MINKNIESNFKPFNSEELENKLTNLYQNYDKHLYVKVNKDNNVFHVYLGREINIINFNTEKQVIESTNMYKKGPMSLISSIKLNDGENPQVVFEYDYFNDSTKEVTDLIFQFAQQYQYYLNRWSINVQDILNENEYKKYLEYVNNYLNNLSDEIYLKPSHDLDNHLSNYRNIAETLLNNHLSNYNFDVFNIIFKNTNIGYKLNKAFHKYDNIFNELV